MAVRFWVLPGTRRLFPGATSIDFSVMHATSYKGTNGDTMNVVTNTLFPTKVLSIEYLAHPQKTGVPYLFGMGRVRTGFKPTNIKLMLFGGASTTSGAGKGMRLPWKTGTNASATKCRIRITGY